MNYIYKIKLKKFISLNYLFFIIYKIFFYSIFYILFYLFIYLFLTFLSFFINYKAFYFHLINYLIISLFPFFLVYPLAATNNKEFIKIIDYKNIVYSYFYIKSKNYNTTEFSELLLKTFYRNFIYNLYLSGKKINIIKIKNIKFIYFLFIFNLIFFILLEFISYKKFNHFFISYISKDEKEIINLEKLVEKKRNFIYSTTLESNEKQFIIEKIKNIQKNLEKKENFINNVELMEKLLQLEKKINQFETVNNDKYENKSKIYKNTKNNPINQEAINNEENRLKKIIERNLINKGNNFKDLSQFYSSETDGFRKNKNKIIIESPLKKYKTFLDILYSIKKSKKLKVVNVYSNSTKIKIINALFNDFSLKNNNLNIIDEDILKLYNIYKGRDEKNN